MFTWLRLSPVGRRCALCFFIIFSAFALHAQLEIGIITGAVSDPTGARIAKAQVAIENPLTGRRRETISDSQGRFRFDNIPYGSYRLSAIAVGFRMASQSVGIHSNVPAQLDIQLNLPSSSSAVTIEEPDVIQVTPSTTTTIDENTIRLMPTVVRRDQLQALVSSTPGWNTENDGLMHTRGVDDGTLYVVNGVPTPDRLDGIFAGSFNTDAITSLNVITGNIPAEFGDRSGAVVVVQPKSGIDTALGGTFSLGGGSFDSGELSSTLSGGTSKLGFFFTGSGHRSDRFLDPVDPRNFNNTGGDASFEFRVDWRITPKDILRLGAIAQGANFGVPNNLEQQFAGQDQRQQVRHDHESIAWQRTWSANTLTDVAYYRDYFRSELFGSAFDTPLTADQNRHHVRQGVLASVSHVAGRHNLKAGVQFGRVSINERFGFAVTDPELAEKAGLSDAAMEFTAANPFQFRDHVNRSTEAVYVQDNFSLLRNLTINAGVRYDHSNLLVSAQQVSPRIGAVYYMTRTKTALRASFNRLYMPPQVENLLIASSPQARELSPFAESGGGADIRPETLSSWEVGFTQQLPKTLSLNVNYWWRSFRNIDDPNVLFSTTLIFPNSVASARAKGLEARLDMPVSRGLSAFVSYTNSQVLEIGPINGGLFLSDEFTEIGPGTRFAPDHDQRNAGAFGVTYTARPRGLWTTFTGRYESGVPLELPDLDDDDLRKLPGANLVNFDTGRVKPWFVLGWSAGMDLVNRERFSISTQVDIQNLTDREFVFNWSNPFSGTHFGYPRLVAGRLKFSFTKSRN